MVVGGEVLRLGQIAGLRDESDGVGDNLAARGGVGLHLLEFLVRELAGLVQNNVGNLDLAHVVQRRGVDHVFNIAVRQNLRELALLPKLLHDDVGVGGGLADVVAGALIAAFHHVRKHEDQAILHFADHGTLMLDGGDILHGLLGGLRQRVIEVFDLVARMDVETLDALDAAAAVLRVVEGKAAGGIGHGIDRQDDVVFREPDAGDQDHDDEAEGEGDNSDKELDRILRQKAHRDVRRGIADAVALFVVDRLVYGQEPAVFVVGDDGIDVPSGEKVVQIGEEGLVKLDHLAGLGALQLRRVEIEDDMAAVGQDAVDIDVFNVLRAVEDVVERGFRVLVARGFFTADEIIFDLLGINDSGLQIDDVFPELDMLVDGRLPVLEIADGAGDDDDQQNSDDEEQQDLSAQRHGAGLAGAHLAQRFIRKRRLLPGVDAEHFEKTRRQKLQDDEYHQADDQLIQKVQDEIRGKLGKEGAETALIQPCAQRGGDAVAEAHPIEQPGDHAAERAAQDRKDDDRHDELPELFEETVSVEEHRGKRDQDVQRAVICRAGVDQAVDQIGQKADDDPRQIAAQRRGEDRADGVQKNRQTERRRQTRAEEVDERASDDEPDNVIERRRAFFRAFERFILHEICHREITSFSRANSQALLTAWSSAAAASRNASVWVGSWWMTRVFAAPQSAPSLAAVFQGV